MAEVCNVATKEVEQTCFDESVPIQKPSFRKPHETEVCRLKRTACQAFAFGGDANSGCH